MQRNELLKYFYELTPIEVSRKNETQTKPNPFYSYLESIGLKNEKNIYHLPSSNFIIPNYKGEASIWEKLDLSPYQSIFRLKKATRYSKEPFSYADFIAIRYVYSGEAIIQTPDTQFQLYKNDICLLNSGFVLSQQLDHDEDIVFTLMFEKDYLIRNVIKNLKDSGVVTRFILDYIMDNKNPQNYIIFHGNENDRISKTIEDMLCEFIDPTQYGDVLIDSYLKILLIEMMNCTYEYSNTSESRQTIKLAEILNYIDTHFENISLNILANEFGYNSKYLSRLIKTYTGKNFKDFIIEKKMSQICLMLSNSELSISQILERNNIQNETFFYKKFKDMYGMTPKEYRDSIQANLI